ncbi:amino acid adenylation domain-containing protein [Roseibium album]|uniref:Linear gramicidin synthase subunit D n=1 Tax=Roseibium album TaxID=311410 RepID=A0A0M7AR69_9HYPH|nr:amino acid adenylation domain-containing protein [Roseibium album]CTQ59975.1 Linear gramicidin synthase subunit D [Roseibium album]CTQ76932.1 Linear gramicidin synthase subunit D [Roseibium album]CTQ77301.1 Linear gramicidin synthase subunit D [Roseibium album]
MPEFSLHTLNGSQAIDPVAPQFLADPLVCLTPADRRKFRGFGWGETVRPRHATIAAALRHWMRSQPDAIAVECTGQTMSYRELDEASNRLAGFLKRNGVKRGDAVCLYLQRSLEMVVGIVATLKLGAAYVPQHVGVAPKKGLRHIANVTGAKVILTLSDVADQVPVEAHQVLVEIDRLVNDEALSSSAPDLISHRAEPDDLTMILFTSGTTGVPNGVQVTHRNLANILLTSPGDLGMRPGLKVGQILSIAFDMAAWEILGALSNGATLVIRGKSIQETAEKVDVLIATPSILSSLDHDRCKEVKAAAVAGEPCPRSLADTWSTFCTFYNSCGPTETTIINTAEPHFVEKKVLSIGRPTPNNTVYILDEDLRPMPIGEKGEMWAGGDCVTAGYLANPKLTDERYRPDPFRPGHMMFRTRDLGRWTEDGELEHFGRVDDLVKIRGFRVELDGVSSALESTDCCIRAVTLKLDDRNLVSFISPASACPEKARQQVNDRLPYYCMPTVVLSLPELPRTPRGKLDKRQLHKLAEDHIASEGVELN